MYGLLYKWTTFGCLVVFLLGCFVFLKMVCISDAMPYNQGAIRLCGLPLFFQQVDIVDTAGHKVDISMEEPMLCPICNTKKARKDFKRLATLAQTKAWLGNPSATKRMTYTGKECNECHKQTKRKTTDLTPEELRKKLVNDGVHPLVIEERIAKRRAQGIKKKSAVMSRTMHAWWQTKKSNNEER
jgi:hypothetical protein